MGGQMGRLGAVLRLMRRWWWAILIAIVLIVRAALPYVLRGQIETRASEALHAAVHVGDVDLALLAGGVALNDVSVRALDAKPDEVPLVSWKRFAVDLRWLSLFRKTIRLSTVELEEPHVALDRLQSGEINLLALVPKSEAPAPESAEPAAQKSSWKFGIDYVGLHRGGVRFRDLLMPDAEPVSIALQSIELKDLALEPEVYGEPADIRFVVRLDEGVLRTRARFTPRQDGGVAVDVTLDATKLPVHRSRVYVPGVAWSDLTGLLSLGLRYRLETGGRNELSGTIGLDDLTVWVAGIDEPALVWKSLGVALERIDLAKHEARVKRVALGGAVIPVRPRGPVVLPVLAAARAAAAAAKSAPKPGGEGQTAGDDQAPDAKAPADAETPSVRNPPADAKPSADDKPAERRAADEKKPADEKAPSAEPPAAPWSWHVASLEITDAHARLLSDQPTLDVGVRLDAKALSAPAHDGSPVTLGIAIGDGSLAVDGTLRLEPIGFDGTVKAAALDVPQLVDVVQAMPKGVLQVAKLDTDVALKLGSSAPTGGDAVVSGTVAVSDLWVAANDPSTFATGAKRVAVAIDDVTVPGALAKGGAGGRATAVALKSVDVESLYSRVTRTETGIMLPAFTTSAASEPATGHPTAKPPAEETPKAKAPAEPAPAATTPAGTAPATQVTIGAVVVGGHVDVTDRTVKPFYFNAFDPFEANLQQIRLPDLEVGALKVHAVSATKGSIDVTGALLKKSDVEIVVKDLALMPFNPYVTGISPYSISRGHLFVTTKAKIDGPSYDTTTWITLSDFDLSSRSGKHVVLEQLGIPVTVAIALLRDWKGNIDLTIPVQIDEKGAAVGLGTVITGALVRALVGTLTSPLKVLGAVLPRGGSGDMALAPVPIEFHPGLSTLDDAGQEQVKQLAGFLAGRPGVGVTLASPATPADVRGLREQALLAKLGPRKGVIGTIRNVGARGRIVDALDARARGEEGALDADDAKALDEYLEDVPAPTADEMKRLAEARLTIVEQSLREQYGIQPTQISRAPIEAGEPVEGKPGVRVDLGSAHQ
jgi:hypothetical protein